MDANIIEIAERFPQMCITVNAGDLATFGRELIDATRREFAEQIRQQTAAELLTREQVAQMFGVDVSTVFRWTQKEYLPAVNVGGAVRYRRGDCVALYESKTARI